ncbi:MAG: F0F1 ATP synthase subunit B [Planctomycetota bacterium]
MMLLMLAAEEGGSPVSFKIMPFITTLIVFGIAFFILATKIWPKILGGLDDRDAKIANEIRSAEEARERADNALKEYESSLAAAREESNQMIAKAKADATAVANELRERNEQQLGDMKQRATQEIESAKQAALNEIHAEAAVLATSIAGKILAREISADDQQALIDESLRELANVSGS